MEDPLNIFSDQEIDRLLGKELISKKILVQFSEKEEPFHIDQNDFRKLFGVNYLSFLKFSHPDFLRKTIKECPFMYRWEVFSQDQNLDEICQKLKEGFVIPSVIRWISPEIGWGLFACQDIEEGELIGEYVGVVRRYFRMWPNKNPFCFHYPTKFWSFHYTVIDAKDEGNELRFLNHSDEPTLRPTFVIDRGILHLTFLAKRRIPKNQELTFDYGKDFWKNRKKIIY